uniref:hypothetical protein n=1 Tax=Agathobacter rectalis TaxID=39491 RepID=UPI004025404F
MKSSKKKSSTGKKRILKSRKKLRAEKTRSKNVNQQPQPHPQPLLLLPPQPKPPQQKRKSKAQIQMLLPLPQSIRPKKETPLAIPHQQHSNRIIHKIEEHPHPLSVLLHEQFVAAKSLISDLQ